MELAKKLKDSSLGKKEKKLGRFAQKEGKEFKKILQESEKNEEMHADLCEKLEHEAKRTEEEARMVVNEVGALESDISVIGENKFSGELRAIVNAMKDAVEAAEKAARNAEKAREEAAEAAKVQP